MNNNSLHSPTDGHRLWDGGRYQNTKMNASMAPAAYSPQSLASNCGCKGQTKPAMANARPATQYTPPGRLPPPQEAAKQPLTPQTRVQTSG